jgi:HEAT repeat protein
VGPALILALLAAAARLGSDDPEARETAAAVLSSSGRAARPLLERLARSADAEVRARAADLLDRIPIPRHRSDGSGLVRKPHDVAPVGEDDPFWLGAGRRSIH